MNRFLLALILAMLCGTPGWADVETDAQPESDTAIPMQVSIDTDADNDTDSEDPARAHLRQRIKTAVQDFIAEELANDPDISDEDRAAIEQRLQERFLLDDMDSDGDTTPGEVVIAILAITLIFGTPIMIVAAVLYSGYRKRRLVRDTVSNYLASGQQVPPEVWQGLSGNTAPRNNLNRGMITLSVGVGVFLCFALMGEMEAAYLALIPLFIGIAQLLIWKLEKSKAGPGE